MARSGARSQCAEKRAEGRLNGSRTHGPRPARRDPNRDADGDGIQAGAQESDPREPEEGAEGKKVERNPIEIRALDSVTRALSAAGWKIVSSGIRDVAKNFT